MAGARVAYQWCYNRQTTFPRSSLLARCHSNFLHDIGTTMVMNAELSRSFEDVLLHAYFEALLGRTSFR